MGTIDRHKSESKKLQELEHKKHFDTNSDRNELTFKDWKINIGSNQD